MGIKTTTTTTTNLKSFIGIVKGERARRKGKKSISECPTNADSTKTELRGNSVG